MPWRVGVISLLVVLAIGTSNQVPVSAQESRDGAAWRELNNRARSVEPVIREAASIYGVDPRALWTIAYLETRFRPGLVSPKGARGMMQFMPATAARFGLGNPHDTTGAIHAAARYVRFLAGHFNNRFDLVLAGYNAGEGAVDAYLRGIALRAADGRIINPRRIQTGGIPPYTETRNYVAQGIFIARSVTASNLFATDITIGRGLLTTPPLNATDRGLGVDALAQRSASEEAAQTPHIASASRYAANEQSLETSQPANRQARRVRSEPRWSLQTPL